MTYMEDYSIIFYWSKSVFLIVSVEVPSQPYMFIFVAFSIQKLYKVCGTYHKLYFCLHWDPLFLTLCAYLYSLILTCFPNFF